MKFNLTDRTILLSVAGSRAYGIHTDTSDVDVKGVCIPTAEYYIGTGKFTQCDDKEAMQAFIPLIPEGEVRDAAIREGFEGTIFEVRRFFELAAEANPNILDILFSREEDLIICTPAGAKLRANRDMFLTKKCLQTFLGYAQAQLNRIQTHRKYLLDPPSHEPTREEFGLPERHEFPQDQVRAAMDMVKKKIDSWNIDFVDVDEALKIYITDQMYSMLTEMHLGTDERHQAAARLLGYDTNFMKFIDSQRKYDSAMNQWKSYNSWKTNRNPKRAGMEAKVSYDAKHGCHLARLIIACRTIFETGTLAVYNPDPWLLDIRQCRVSFDDLLAWVEIEKKGLAELAVKSSLPSRVDTEKMNALAIEVIRAHL